MTFNVQRLVLASAGGNAGMKLTTDTAGDPLIVNGPQLWTYESAVDNIAAIGAANYFSEKAFAMSVGDMIMANGSDASNMFVVLSVDTTVVPNLISVDSFSMSGVVATANIQDLAVTTAKINDLAVTTEKLAANAVTLPKLGSDVAAVASVTLSSAQLKAMYATPVSLVAAPGVNNLIVVEEIIYDITYGTAQYTAGGVIKAQFGSAANGAGDAACSTIAAASLNGVAANAILSMSPAALTTTPTNALNAAIYLSNQTAAFATGDSTAVAKVRYHVVSLA